MCNAQEALSETPRHKYKVGFVLTFISKDSLT